MCLIVPLLFHPMFIHSFFLSDYLLSTYTSSGAVMDPGDKQKKKKKSQKGLSLKAIDWQANNQINDLINIIAICITKEECRFSFVWGFSCHNLLVTFSYLPACIHARVLLFELLFYTKYMWKAACFSFLEDASTKCIIVCMFNAIVQELIYNYMPFHCWPRNILICPLLSLVSYSLWSPWYFWYSPVLTPILFKS